MLQQICRLIAADEFRHFKLFYDHMRRYLARENLSFMTRLRIAAGRITESEDDELAFAYHCSNEDEGTAYEHKRCIASYMAHAMAFYRFRHIERSVGMIFKSIGLPPRGRMSDMASKLLWQMVQRRQKKFVRQLARDPAASGQVFARAA